jgi:uncharacterized protein DUF6766
MNTMASKHSFFYKNGLTIVFLVLMIFSLGGQIYTGRSEHNEFLSDHGRAEQSLSQYLLSGHFLQATFENWESEFFQMALFVLFTIFLRQQGSSESKDCDEESFDKEDLQPNKDSPWPVKKGGMALALYKHSLSISLFLLFLLSFFLHWYGSWMDFNEQQEIAGKAQQAFTEYVVNKRLWFESFQNWQSEFLSIFSIIFLSIYLRQYGSSQSKPVNASHSKTGED